MANKKINTKVEVIKGTITFIPKKCPECNELLAVKNLGAWGYYCTECLMWWGTYDPYPLVNGKEQD